MPGRKHHGESHRSVNKYGASKRFRLSVMTEIEAQNKGCQNVKLQRQRGVWKVWYKFELDLLGKDKSFDIRVHSKLP